MSDKARPVKYKYLIWANKRLAIDIKLDKGYLPVG